MKEFIYFVDNWFLVLLPHFLCFWTVVLKTLKSPLDCKEVKPVHPKGNQSWIFTGRTDAETETPVLWPPDMKDWLIGKDPDNGKDWRQEEKGMKEDEMVGWHHWLDGHEFEQAPELVMDREAWRAAVYGVSKSWTWPRDWTKLICQGDYEQCVISFRGFPVGSVCKESACNAGQRLQCRRIRYDPGSEISPWEEKAAHSSILAWEVSWIAEPYFFQVKFCAKIH